LTNLGRLRVNDRVNLERPLTLTSRLGGHLVSGHVEDTVALLARKQVGDYLELTFSCPAQASKYIVKKGSVAVDGISLTVADCDFSSFSAVIIPHTAHITTLSIRKVGERMNLETDIIGKYVERLLAFAGKETGQGITVELLKQTGFL
jgi:riboflavin synthase